MLNTLQAYFRKKVNFIFKKVHLLGCILTRSKIIRTIALKYFDITNVALEISQVNSPSEFRALFVCHNTGISHAFRAEMP